MLSKPTLIIPVFGILIGLSLVARADAETNSDSSLFARAHMTSVSLEGFQVWLGTPVEVTAQAAWNTSWLNPDGAPRSGYLHFFPLLARFPNGNILVTYSLDPDALDNPVFISGYQISEDGGAHWGRRLSVLTQHPAIFLPKSQDSLLALPFNLLPKVPGADRDFVGPSFLFKRGGERLEMVTDGMKVTDLPWPVEIEAGSQPSNCWPARLSVGGNALNIQGGLAVTAYFRKRGERCYNSILLFSADGGISWHYYSTIAAPDRTLALALGYEGPNETSVVRLADGSLMAVFRIGSGERWKLRRNYSYDEGHTWTQPEAIPAFSVFPQLLRTTNGTIILSSGRPGIDLWLSVDSKGSRWQRIDLVAYHNQHAVGVGAQIKLFPAGDDTKSQTTSYTAMVETSPNKVLLCYDRDPVIRPPETPPADAHDLSRVFVIAIDVGQARSAISSIKTASPPTDQ